MNKIETIDNRWDILYKEYPDVYDRFARTQSRDSIIGFMRQVYSFEDKVVVDIGSGSGLSTFDLAQYARSVIGVEPEDAMRNLSIENAKKRGVNNVSFVKGSVEKIPLEGGSVDVVTAFTSCPHLESKIEAFVNESGRVIHRGGYVFIVDVAPEWYGGELAPVILGESRMTHPDYDGIRAKILEERFAFGYHDVFTISDFGTVENAVSTYGFIFGKKAIDYLREHQKTQVKWKFRVHYKQI